MYSLFNFTIKEKTQVGGWQSQESKTRSQIVEEGIKWDQGICHGWSIDRNLTKKSIFKKENNSDCLGSNSVQRHFLLAITRMDLSCSGTFKHLNPYRVQLFSVRFIVRLVNATAKNSKFTTKYNQLCLILIYCSNNS